MIATDEVPADVRGLQGKKASTKEKIFQLTFEFISASRWADETGEIDTFLSTINLHELGE
jgi:hypothetical protein